MLNIFFNNVFDVSIFYLFQCNLLSNQKEIIKVDQAIVDFTFFSQKVFITEEVIRAYVIKKDNRQTIHSKPFLPYTGFGKKLNDVGVACFEWNDVFKLLKSNIFLKNHLPSKNTQLIQFFKQLSEAEKPKKITDAVIKKWSFILDHKNALNNPTNIYFPTPDDKNWNDQNSEISFLHQDVQNFLLKNPETREWLEKLGVIEKTDLTYLRKTIIENASTYSTHENSVPTILNIFSLYAKGDIGKKVLSELSELKVLTQKGTLLPAKSCYFSDAYSPRLKLESVLTDNIFVSEKYIIDTSSDKDEWKRFFKMMGVKEGIAPVKHEKKLRSNLVDDFSFQDEYFQQDDKVFTPHINSFVADTYAGLVKPIFLSKTQDYEFSKLFWTDILESTKISDIEAKVTAFWGIYGKRGRNNGSQVQNYLKWYVKNNSCIPTSTEMCHRTDDVFINSEDLIRVAGSYMPVFEGGELSPDWRAFFNFKVSLELEDYLHLLTNIISDNTEKGTTKKDNDDRIQLIYGWFLDSCTNFSGEERLSIQEWAKSSFLPDKDGNIHECSDLNYFIDGDVSIFQGQLPFIFINASNRKHQELETFLELFGVEILRQSEFKLNHSEKIELIDLQNRLKTVLPYLMKWLEKTEQDSVSDKILKLKDKVENLQIFTSDSLEITYGKDWKKAVQVHFNSNVLHVTTPWNSNKVMLDLSEQLCRYLDIRGHEKELDFLLKVENTQEIKDYFSQEEISLPQLQVNVSFNNFADASPKIVLTPDILASAGISTQEELEKRLKDPEFAKMFTHSSTSSFSMLQYALKLIKRAKKNIIAHLNTLDEYDCSECEPVADSIIGGVKKNGEDIYIVARPSDNNEVIIYYPAEFDTLDYTESELWYENGKDKPEKMTLGNILKVTGVNRIPI